MFRRKQFSFRGRRFHRPVAHKRVIWVSKLNSFTETAGAVSTIILVNPADWEDSSTSGNTAGYCKYLKTLLHVAAAPLATTESRFYTINHDDSTMVYGDPTIVANWAKTDAVHMGTIFVPSAGTPVPVFNGYPDNIRDIKVNRKAKQDESLAMVFQPAAAAADQLTITVVSRVLCQLG